MAVYCLTLRVVMPFCDCYKGIDTRFSLNSFQGGTMMERSLERRKVIIDCDPGIDDALALLLALNSKELEVVGITISSGNVPSKQGAENALRVLAQCGKTHIPVYAGEAVPLKRELVTAQDTHGEDGLGETFYHLPEGISYQ